MLLDELLWPAHLDLLTRLLEQQQREEAFQAARAAEIQYLEEQRAHLERERFAWACRLNMTPEELELQWIYGSANSRPPTPLIQIGPLDV